MDLDRMRQQAEPMITRGLDRFAHRADLAISFTVAGVEITSKSHNDTILALVHGLLAPVFSQAGWGFRSRQGYRKHTLVFSPPLDAAATGRRRGMR
jgi:hypothetical protein